MSIINIFKKKTPEEKIRIERQKLEKEAVKKYFSKENTNIYYKAQKEAKEAMKEANDIRAISKFKTAWRLQTAYEDGINDIRNQFLGKPTTQWYLDLDLDYPNNH